MTQYRIVRGPGLFGKPDYTVQVWRWWFPFWVEADVVNSHESVESAEKWAQMHATKGVEKTLGHWSGQ